MNISIPDQMHKQYLRSFSLMIVTLEVFFFFSLKNAPGISVHCPSTMRGGNCLAGLMDLNAWFPDGGTDFSFS